MSVFFVVAWAVALVCFLVVPMVASKEVRQRWYRGLRYCEWTTTTATPTQQGGAAGAGGGGATTDSDQAPETEQFHYRVSSTQEDEIRESFLVERLKPFTMTLKASDIQLTQDDHTTTIMSEETASTLDLDAQTGADPVVPKDNIKSSNSNNINNNNHDYNENSDDCSSDGENASLLVDDFAADRSSHVSVPLPGYSLPDNDYNSTPAYTTTTTTTGTKQSFSKRQIPNGCAICLCAFEATDKVTWSSNQECKHVFHADCVLNWLKTSGRRHLRRRRRQEHRSGNQVLAYAVDPLIKITNFPMVCPCCRQVFVVAAEKNIDNNNKKKVIREALPSSTTTTTSEASSSAESVGDEESSSSSNAPVEHGTEAEGTNPNTILAVPVVVGSDDNV